MQQTSLAIQVMVLPPVTQSIDDPDPDPLAPEPLPDAPVPLPDVPVPLPDAPVPLPDTPVPLPVAEPDPDPEPVAFGSHRSSVPHVAPSGHGCWPSQRGVPTL